MLEKLSYEMLGELDLGSHIDNTDQLRQVIYADTSNYGYDDGRDGLRKLQVELGYLGGLAVHSNFRIPDHLLLTLHNASAFLVRKAMNEGEQLAESPVVTFFENRRIDKVTSYEFINSAFAEV